MRTMWFACAFLLCASSVWAQNSSFPDLSDFTQSPTENFIDQVYEPFHVRSVTGAITIARSEQAIPKVLFEIEGPGSQRTIRHGVSDNRGVLKISHVPQGTYRFKATLNGISSVIGTIVVSRNGARSSKITIKMSLGM